jgi:hypothetical protein
MYSEKWEIEREKIPNPNPHTRIKTTKVFGFIGFIV